MDEDRTWIVERTWIVRARTATNALDAALPGKHNFVRVHEAPMPNPDTEDDGIDWAEVARADRELRGECWYEADADGLVANDAMCQVHYVVHEREA